MHQHLPKQMGIIGSGTDVAMESADIVLMRSDLMEPTAVELSKATIKTSKKIFLGICL